MQGAPGSLSINNIVKWAPIVMQDTTRENKLRLLMILAAIYPEKFDGEKGLNLMKVGLVNQQNFISCFSCEVNYPVLCLSCLDLLDLRDYFIFSLFAFCSWQSYNLRT